MLKGKYEEQYNKLIDYANELKMKNQNTIVEWMIKSDDRGIERLFIYFSYYITYVNIFNMI